MRTKRRRKRKFIRRIIRLFTLIILGTFFLKEADTTLNKMFNYRTNEDLAKDQSKYKNYLNDIFDNMEGNETKRVLKSMAKQDKRIKTILENYNDYPEELLEMLSRNIEMIDFVLDYPNKKGEVYADTIGNISKNTMPLLQYDQRWGGYGDYGDSIIAISGCGPTALSMVIAELTGDNSITPYKVAKFAENNGYYVSGVGTTWDLFTEGSKSFGLQASELSLTEASIYNALRSGKLIICSMRPGDFTTTGHIIVLSEIENGKIAVYDPNSNERSNKLWDYQTLEHQIRNLWVFSTK